MVNSLWKWWYNMLGNTRQIGLLSEGSHVILMLCPLRKVMNYVIASAAAVWMLTQKLVHTHTNCLCGNKCILSEGDIFRHIPPAHPFFEHFSARISRCIILTVFASFQWMFSPLIFLTDFFLPWVFGYRNREKKPVVLLFSWKTTQK